MVVGSVNSGQGFRRELEVTCQANAVCLAWDSAKASACKDARMRGAPVGLARLRHCRGGKRF